VRQPTGPITKPAGAGVRPIDAGLMAVGVFGVSTSGPLIAACAAPVLAVAFWRTALAVAADAPLVLSREAGALAGLRGRELRLTLIAGALLAGHFAAWVVSLRMTSVASSTALVCLQAGWAVLFSWLAGDRPTRPVLAGLALVLAGVALVVTGGHARLLPK
jgi:drug/metabolite transporter (DMT)-like permease